MTGFRKSIVLLLVLVVSVPAVFATGTDEVSGDMEDVTLQVRYIGPADQADQEMVFEAFNAELTDYLPGTQVEIEIVSGADYGDRWQLALAAGEQLDVAGRYWMQNLETEVARGAFLPLDDLLDEYGQDLVSELPGWVLAKGATGGQIYEIPNYQIMTALRYSAFAQADLAETYGLREIAAQIEPKEFMDAEGWDLLTDYFVATQEDGMLRAGPSTTLEWLNQKGFDWVGATGKAIAYEFNTRPVELVSLYGTEQVRESYATIADWFERGLIREDVLAMDNPRADDGPNQDGTTMYIHGFVGTVESASAAVTARWGYPWVNYPLDYEWRVSYAHTATNTAIPSTAEYPERAMQFINLLNSAQGADLLNMLTWGIEGEHYTVVSEATANLPKRIETIGYAGQGNSDSAFGLWKWAMGNTENSWLTQSDTDAYIEDWTTANEQANPSPLLGWVPDNTAVRTQEAQITAVVGEYQFQLAYGALGDDWEATYNDFLAALDAAGIDDVIAEYQSQIDEYLGQ